MFIQLCKNTTDGAINFILNDTYINDNPYDIIKERDQLIKKLKTIDTVLDILSRRNDIKKKNTVFVLHRKSLTYKNDIISIINDTYCNYYVEESDDEYDTQSGTFKTLIVIRESKNIKYSYKLIYLFFLFIALVLIIYISIQIFI